MDLLIFFKSCIFVANILKNEMGRVHRKFPVNSKGWIHFTRKEVDKNKSLAVDKFKYLVKLIRIVMRPEEEFVAHVNINMIGMNPQDFISHLGSCRFKNFIELLNKFKSNRNFDDSFINHQFDNLITLLKNNERLKVYKCCDYIQIMLTRNEIEDLTFKINHLSRNVLVHVIKILIKYKLLNKNTVIDDEFIINTNEISHSVLLEIRKCMEDNVNVHLYLPNMAQPCIRIRHELIRMIPTDMVGYIPDKIIDDTESLLYMLDEHVPHKKDRDAMFNTSKTGMIFKNALKEAEDTLVDKLVYYYKVDHEKVEKENEVEVIVSDERFVELVNELKDLSEKKYYLSLRPTLNIVKLCLESTKNNKEWSRYLFNCQTGIQSNLQ